MKKKIDPIASLTGVGFKIRSRIWVKSCSNVCCSICRQLKKLD